MSRLPVIRGLADERLRLQIDGMDLYAACPNHMNTPLSYLDPGQVERVRVWAGIAPVSAGGDAIGGVVAAETPAPTFAAPGQTGTRGEVGVSARSNGHAWGQWGVRGQLSYVRIQIRAPSLPPPRRSNTKPHSISARPEDGAIFRPCLACLAEKGQTRSHLVTGSAVVAVEGL